MSKKSFTLGDDVALALMKIVSINDDLPTEYRQKIEKELENERDILF